MANKSSDEIEKREIKQNNFRFYQDNADDFRKFCEENGYNQAQGFDYMMQILELDQAKAEIPGRQTEIEEYEKSMKSVNDIYLHSLKLYEEAETMAKEQFNGQLESKDKVIADLQSRLEAAEVAEKNARECQEVSEKSEAALRARAETAEREREAAEKTADDKEQINSILSEKIAGQEKALAERDELLKSIEEDKRQIVDLEAQLKDAERAIQSNKEQLKIQTDLAAEKAAREAEKAMMDQVRSVDKENARLQAQIEQMRSQISKQEG